MKTHLQYTHRLLPSEESLLRKTLGTDHPLPIFFGSHQTLGSFLEKIRKEKIILSTAQANYLQEVLDGLKKTPYHV